MIIHSYENTRRADACVDYLGRLKDAKNIEKLYLLPIPSTRDKSTISGTNIYIYDVLDMLDESSMIVGYALPRDFVSRASAVGASVHDVSLDEKFLLANASLTAEATIGIILGTTTRALSDMTVGIVGYGRIGKQLTRLLLYFGSRVRVYTSNRGTLLDLSEQGLTTEVSDSDADLSGVDILVNTAPVRIFDTENPSFPRDIRVIDLASGVNFPMLPAVERYPSIPAKMFPETAGVLWGMSIERFIKGG